MLAEGTAAVHTFTASDETDVFWSINGGTDGDLFDIDQNTGALTFKTVVMIRMVILMQHRVIR